MERGGRKNRRKEMMDVEKEWKECMGGEWMDGNRWNGRMKRRDGWKDEWKNEWNERKKLRMKRNERMDGRNDGWENNTAIDTHLISI